MKNATTIRLFGAVCVVAAGRSIPFEESWLRYLFIVSMILALYAYSLAETFDKEDR